MCSMEEERGRGEREREILITHCQMELSVLDNTGLGVHKNMAL